jgi:hypothetical protein
MNSQLQAYIDYFFKKAEVLVPAVINMHSYLTWKVFRTGSCLYADPLTKVQVPTAEFSYPIESTLFPTGLTSTARWSQPATATGITDLYNLSTAFFDINGFYPSAYQLSTKTFRQLQAQASTKAAVIGNAGAMGRRGTPVPITSGASSASDNTNIFVELAEINAELQRRDIPPLVIYDGQFEQENADGSFTRTRFTDDDYVIALTDGMAERAVLPLAEKNFEPGIFTLYEVIDQAPRKERAVAMASGVPFVRDSRVLCAQKVDAAA